MEGWRDGGMGHGEKGDGRRRGKEGRGVFQRKKKSEHLKLPSFPVLLSSLPKTVSWLTSSPKTWCRVQAPPLLMEKYLVA